MCTLQKVLINGVRLADPDHTMRLVTRPCRRRWPFIGQIRRRLWVVICIVTPLMLYKIYNPYPAIHSVSLFDADRTYAGLLQQSGQACVHPTLALHNPEIDAFYGVPDPLRCAVEEGQEWIRTDGGRLRISAAAKRNHGGSVNCRYVPIQWGRDDFDVARGEPVENVVDGDRLTSDFIEVDCKGADGTRYRRKHAGIAVDDAVAAWSSTGKNDAEQPPRYDVIIWGFDSVSQMSWRRSLPRATEYFVDVLGGRILEGYNIVGDGTTQALLAMFTGRFETELPEARRGYPDASTVDGFPWVWKRFRDVEYATQFGEDNPGLGTFTYRLMGFAKQPVDHYLRPFYLALESDWLYPNCVTNSMPSHLAMLNWQLEFVRTYRARPKFSFVFNSRLTHGTVKDLSLADNDVTNFLRALHNESHLDNAVLILMSDHGARFDFIRNTDQGRLEERNPFFGIRLPPSLLRRRPDAALNLATNVHRLSTPFDVHATLLDLLGETATAGGRGISLLTVIPKSRTCRDAGIESHWCACLAWSPASPGDGHVMNASSAVVAMVNELTEVHRNVCARQELVNITTAVKFTPGEGLLKFRRSLDEHGRLPDLSDDRSAAEHLYQLTVVTSPGGAVYEATVKYLPHVDRYDVSPREISRLDRYGTQPRCVMDRFPHLRQFCYCVTAERITRERV